MSQEKVTIHLEQGSAEKMPWPIHLDAKNRAQRGLGVDDGAVLIGFAEPGKQELKVFAHAALADPALVVGLWPIFSNNGGFFNWTVPVRKIEVHDG